MSGFLFLRLTGPLQSWGTMECAEHRHTGPRPSKAAVLGLIAAGLGISRGGDAEKAWLPVASRWPMTTWAGFGRTTLEGESLPSHRPVLLEDFQTVPKFDPRFTDKERSVHKIKSGDTTVWRISPRANALPGTTSRYANIPNFIGRKTYLADADFVVCFEIAEPTDAQAALDALLCPVWQPFLGRKCCVPSQPVLIGLFDEKSASVTHGDQVLLLSTGTQWAEASEGGEQIETVVDVPTSFDPRRRGYGSRKVEVSQPADEVSEWFQ